VFEVLAAAERWLTFGTADVMVACLLSTRAHDRDGARSGDGALVLSLTTPAFARARGWPVIGQLTVDAGADECVRVQGTNAPAGRAPREVAVAPSPGLSGFDDLARALEDAARGGATELRWRHAVAGDGASPTGAAAVARGIAH
jgi:hypothetical protein